MQKTILQILKSKKITLPVLILLILAIIIETLFTQLQETNKESQNLQNSNSEIEKQNKTQANENANNQTNTPITNTHQNSKENKEKAKVKKVIDGDTIELENRQIVRYIGINTPETKDARKGVECFGQEAFKKNKELVEGKEIFLEKDVSEKDKYGRLLRYVYVNDLFVNEYLVLEGYAYAITYPPDVKYQTLLKNAQEKAKAGSVGLWAKCRQ
ncbi:MAG: thermonuclease family protein [Patescibacteria group bacterium]|nr:thermonuclease family protein [Patescibacteria group bacterium]